MSDLNVTLVQCELAWEQPADNRHQFETAILEHGQPTDLIVLPEMFTTGFSMNALANAEPAEGETLRWMQHMAERLDCAVTGSIATRIEDRVYNRLLFVTPDAWYHYDKRHLFRMAGEHQRYAPGAERVVVCWRGWKLLLQVCYDLRFPVFSRNVNDYDGAIYVANWPATRAHHWRALLPARAIENSAYTIGVNRIGADANGLCYQGDSMAIAPDGGMLADLSHHKTCQTITLSQANLQHYRERFPTHLDADSFTLHNVS
jgi:predicted amidohydrolase